MTSSTDYKTDANCIFCKIVKGDIPSFRLIDTDRAYAFFDIGPLAKGHALVIPKYHGAKLHDIPDEDLTTLLPIVKKIAVAVGSEDYNVLQHVHFHMIPKPSASDDEGLVVGWPTKPAGMADLKAYCEEIKNKLSF
ncbi:BQ2448_6355 [Microbotryum intermedium]|uniref:BQ2448_6355 protein n=1 Tax=Microbotryum intermedium TaxID=269621 RepID=A0A238FL81_9BASI|nr:BQ2448_6355 [Microbotryum intermedium]